MAMTGGTAKLVSSGKPPGWPGAISLYVYYKVVSQSVANNNTKLALGMYVTTPNNYDIGKWSDWNGSYIGTATSGANCKTFDGTIPNFAGTRWLVENQEVTVSHNGDGTKNATIYWHWGVNSGWSGVMNNPSGSFSVELPDIPRAATITAAPNFTDEENPTISYSNPAGSAVSSLQACISFDGSKDDIVYRDISKTGNSYTFNLTNAERAVLRNATTTANSRNVTFFVRTVIGSASYHSTLKKTLSIVNANPTISPTITDSNSATVALTGNNSKFVRYCSDAQITIGAAALKGATLKSTKVTNSGKSLTENGTISGVTSGSFVFTATDSRGNKTSLEVTKTLIDYVKLTCNISNNKPDTSGNLAFKVTGNYFNGSFGAVSNTLTVHYRYKVSGGSYGSWTTMTATKSGNAYTATANLTGLDYQTVYVFQAYAVDKLTTTATAEKNVKAQPVFDWGENDFKFNVPVYDRFGTEINNGLAAYTGSGTDAIDPNTTLEHLVLTNKNTPTTGFHYVYTSFYNSKGTTNNRAQFALPYNATGCIYYRFYSGGVWSDWTGCIANGVQVSGSLDLKATSSIRMYGAGATNAVAFLSDRIRSTANDAHYLGDSTYKWKTVYAVNGTIQTSDRNQKTDIADIDQRYIDLFDKLRPVSFAFSDPESDRIHIGFISQDVEAAMEEVGLTDLDFAGFCRDALTEWDEETQTEKAVVDEDGNPVYLYSLRYSEFIALNSKMIQVNRKKIDEQQRELDALKAEVAELKHIVQGLVAQA